MDMSWMCTRCEAVMPEASDSSWRWNGELWQHKCPNAPPQAGHFDAKLSSPKATEAGCGGHHTEDKRCTSCGMAGWCLRCCPCQSVVLTRIHCAGVFPAPFLKYQAEQKEKEAMSKKTILHAIRERPASDAIEAWCGIVIPNSPMSRCTAEITEVTCVMCFRAMLLVEKDKKAMNQKENTAAAPQRECTIDDCTCPGPPPPDKVPIGHDAEGNIVYEDVEMIEPETSTHPAVEHIMQFFTFMHLPEPLQLIVAPCRTLAFNMVENLPQNPELTAGLRKLLEAKDCFVRARLASDSQCQHKTRMPLASHDPKVPRSYCVSCGAVVEKREGLACATGKYVDLSTQ